MKYPAVVGYGGKMSLCVPIGGDNGDTQENALAAPLSPTVPEPTCKVKEIILGVVMKRRFCFNCARAS